jgi:drug/metabolite transporter (DMT)-like permease
MSAPAPAAALRDRRRTLLGSATVVAVALVFTVCVVLAKRIYDAGGNALTVLAVRYAAGAAMLFLAFRLRGQSPFLPRPLALKAVGLGLMVSGYAYGYLGAIQYIPISLAVLIFYTNPLFVALAAWMVERERPAPSTLLAILIGLLGVALAVEVDFATLDWRGLALAALGAVGVAITVTASQRTMRSTGSLHVTFYINLVAAIVYAAIGLGARGLAFPGDAAGWLALAALPIFFVAGITLFFGAIGIIGAVKTATIMNAEPVFTVLAAVLLLGERLTALQLLGATLVLAAILLVHRRH